jgi:hypothetical protein
MWSRLDFFEQNSGAEADRERGTEIAAFWLNDRQRCVMTIVEAMHEEIYSAPNADARTYTIGLDDDEGREEEP